MITYFKFKSYIEENALENAVCEMVTIMFQPHVLRDCAGFVQLPNVLWHLGSNSHYNTENAVTFQGYLVRHLELWTQCCVKKIV